jgi:hypothetical protein
MPGELRASARPSLSASSLRRSSSGPVPISRIAEDRSRAGLEESGDVRADRGGPQRRPGDPRQRFRGPEAARQRALDPRARRECGRARFRVPLMTAPSTRSRSTRRPRSAPVPLERGLDGQPQPRRPALEPRFVGAHPPDTEGRGPSFGSRSPSRSKPTTTSGKLLCPRLARTLNAAARGRSRPSPAAGRERSPRGPGLRGAPRTKMPTKVPLPAVTSARVPVTKKARHVWYPGRRPRGDPRVLPQDPALLREEVSRADLPWKASPGAGARLILEIRCGNGRSRGLSRQVRRRGHPDTSRARKAPRPRALFVCSRYPEAFARRFGLIVAPSDPRDGCPGKAAGTPRRGPRAHHPAASSWRPGERGKALHPSSACAAGAAAFIREDWTPARRPLVATFTYRQPAGRRRRGHPGVLPGPRLGALPGQTVFSSAAWRSRRCAASPAALIVPRQPRAHHRRAALQEARSPASGDRDAMRSRTFLGASRTTGSRREERRVELRPGRAVSVAAMFLGRSEETQPHSTRGGNQASRGDQVSRLRRVESDSPAASFGRLGPRRFAPDRNAASSPRTNRHSADFLLLT